MLAFLMQDSERSCVSGQDWHWLKYIQKMEGTVDIMMLLLF